MLGRYQRGECTAEEQRRIRAWYDGLGAEQQLDLDAEERAALLATVWQRIATQTTGRLPTVASAVPAASRTNRTWPSSLAWAAAAVLVLGTGLTGVYLSRNAVSTPEGEPARSTAAAWVVHTNPTARPVAVALLDGTLVTLAPASSLKYPRRFQGPQRTVYLTGEGFFDVFHDAAHPFLVYTDQVVTTVLGTSFTVRAHAGQPSVVVRVNTGRVRVAPRSRAAGTPANAPASVVVVPNQQAVYSAARQQLRRELVAAPVLLAPQPFVFDNRPVAEVLAALEKAYGVSIAYDAAAVRNCTLNLSLGSEPLFKKLDIICEALGATYGKADGRILFHSRPCLPE
ncbi:hypothetical protein BEN48_11105 [Hymenobacter glacialis]|uniref:FecR protein domain-containing protein n=1 Tax=Hymenobacter glacialis TaxID=1908236 RepID=A0A1G1T9I8_9BACT|nr:hypothetical protein BEN48_11105 [Hymenobacter glacialis]